MAGILPVILSALLFQFLWSGCAPAPARADSSTITDLQALPVRIISTAPSITETVFAVGAGDKLVGVTKFCKYPPQSQLLPKIGGLLDSSEEAIVRLEPDLVITLEENRKIMRAGTAGGYSMLAVDHKSIPGIIDSVESIGRACGREGEGLLLASELRRRIEQLEKNQTGKQDPPKVVISVGRNAGSGKLGNVYIAGNDNYYGKMIHLAGGVNAYSGSIRYPAVSIEGLLRMDPDVIIDLVPDYRAQGIEEENLLSEWEEVREVTAFKNGDIHIMGEDFWTLPGPRFIRIVEELSLILNQ